jgi:membrane fusion protein (multidrug efflux system)
VAQVRARVTGIVQQRLFTEGSAEVRAGQPLFRIDAAPYQAALDSAQAQLARAQANLAQTTATAERYKPLAEAKAISQQDYANAAGGAEDAEADVAAGRAAVLSARINLGYAQVTAPIAGRIGRALVTEGALVSATEATPLALIQQDGTVYVNFTQSSAEVLQAAQGPGRRPVAPPTRRPSRRCRGGARGAGRRHRTAAPRQAAVQRPDGGRQHGPGHAARRSAQPRWPAAARPVRAGAPGAGRTACRRAGAPAGRDPHAQGDTVLVVGEGNKPTPRPVTVAGSQNGQWVVTGGLPPATGSSSTASRR